MSTGPKSNPEPTTGPQPSDPPPTSFESEPEPSLLAEFWDFLRYNKKWWLLPIIVTLGLLAALFWLSTTGLAPFIYTFS
jgi:hypothetical protein